MTRHRLFFGLVPPASVQAPIGEHANACAGESRVAAGRLHVTLAITEIYPDFPEAVARDLHAFAGTVRAAPIALSLEKISARGEVVVLLPGRTAPALRDLQDQLQGGMVRRGLLMKGWTFNPHLTLTYKHGGLPFTSRIDPIAWEACDFVLLDSHIGKGHYEELGRWPLETVQGSLF